MKFNPNKYSLSQQMTFVIAAALVSQLVFVGALTIAHYQLEKQFEAEAHSRKLMTAANSLILNLLRVGTAMGFYQFSKEEGFKRNFQTALLELSKRKEALEKLQSSENGKMSEPEMQLMLQQLDESFKLFKDTEGVFESGDEAGKRYAVYRISRQAKTLSQLNDRFVAKQDEKTAAHEKLEAQTRMWVNSIVYGGLTVNISLVIFLLLYFNSRTSKRFNKLSKNIVALGANREIPSRLDGADELAMLDDVVHAVSRALQEAERSKQEVLAMVTHDLRSPLTSLQLTLNLLHSGSMDNSSDKAKNMIARADSSVGKLIQLINDLLDIDKIESGRFNLNMQETEDASMISQAVELIQHSADARKITIETNAANLDVNCDEERIIRVLTNLIANAVKFSPDGSKIVVSTTPAKDDILFEVKDQGRGMPAGEQEKIFERYHQVDSSDEAEKKGSGLGLTICKSLIEAHQGTIGATSKEGEGSTFWFRIPLAAKTPTGSLDGATLKIKEPNAEPISAAKKAD